jgi:enoyl-CoA hydratase/carnithine racemase
LGKLPVFREEVSANTMKQVTAGPQNRLAVTTPARRRARRIEFHQRQTCPNFRLTEKKLHLDERGSGFRQIFGEILGLNVSDSARLTIRRSPQGGRVHLDTMYSTVEDRVATVVFNRPEVLNCANETWTRDLNTLVDDLAGYEGLRVVVVRGAGRAFCSGIDLSALAEGQTTMTFFRNWEGALRKLELMDPIVIAAIQSHCIGGGLQVALACDLRVARDDARFGITAVKEGIIPGIGMWRAARYAGLGRAQRLAVAAEVIDAATALDWGLVDWVVDAASFDAKINELTERVLSMGWTSTRLTKKLTRMAFETSFDEFVETYFDYQQRSITSPEHLQVMADHRANRAARRLP